MTEYLSNKIRTISFFAILLVFLQHSINFTGYIAPDSLFFGQSNVNTIIQYVVGYGLARPAVTLFFLLSGYLFFRNFILAKTFEKYKSRFRTLLVPYILWNFFAILFVIFLQFLLRDYFYSFYTGYLPGKSIFTYAQMIYHHGVAFQLWFLYDLILYALFAPVIYVLVRYLSVFLLLPLCLIWLFRIPIPSFLAFLDRGGLFYLLGAYIAMHPICVSNTASRKLFISTGLLWLISLAVKTYITFIPGGFVTYLPIIDNAAIMLGLCAIWFGYDAYANSRAMSWLGSQALFTFFIYAAHEPLLEILKYIPISSRLLLFFLVPVLTYGICVGLAHLLKHYTFSIYKILTGGR